MTPTEQIQDEILRLKAELAGKRIELATARGNRPLARKHLRIMESLIKTRRAKRIEQETRNGGCYFLAAGQVDREMVM